MTQLRVLDAKTMATLDKAAGYYASKFLANAGRETRDWVMQQFYNFYYKDEFNYLVEAVRKLLGPDALADFNARLAQLPPRSDEVFKQYLEKYQPRGYTPQNS